tara:strand:+ start:1951 stop:3093 length:1143 start_codon:yes stop_codon:yes gene_type:complete
MKKIKTDFLIIGAGLYGCVLAERITKILKKKVVILEERPHIGGNCYSEYDKSTGIEYNKYGPHIFHTSIDSVWTYINDFTKFNTYKHQALARFKDKIYQLPINLETINSFFDKNFSPNEAKNFLLKKTLRFKKKSPKNFEEKALSQIGKDLYEAFIKNYTTKQWGKNPKHLPSSIFNRLPLRFNYNEDYFNSSKYQGIPLDGYTKLFRNLTTNKNIELIYNTKFQLNSNIEVKKLTIFTGPLDKLFNYKFGKLEWRSLNFKKETLDTDDFQGTSIINYPELKYKFTRIYEPRHLHTERTINKNKTIIIKEFPTLDNSRPYYPINDSKNRNLHRKYKNFINTQKNLKIIVGGRLGDYAYYDMDMTISAALKKFEFIKKNFS